MTPEEKAGIKTEIEQRIQDSEKNLDTLREQIKPVPPSVALGRITRMDAIQQKSMAEANLKSTEEYIERLKKALLRIDDEKFAICMACGSQIPIERMLAIPEANVCVPCIQKSRK